MIFHECVCVMCIKFLLQDVIGLNHRDSRIGVTAWLVVVSTQLIIGLMTNDSLMTLLYYITCITTLDLFSAD
jgi:hypothetical protein